jgi:hypothetical protein
MSAVLALAIGACTSSGAIMSGGNGQLVLPCDAAYSTAVKAHAQNHKVSDFDSAIATCNTFADWTHAVAADPAALGADPMVFLRDRCQHAQPLAAAVICAPIAR